MLKPGRAPRAEAASGGHHLETLLGSAARSPELRGENRAVHHVLKQPPEDTISRRTLSAARSPELRGEEPELRGEERVVWCAFCGLQNDEVRTDAALAMFLGVTRADSDSLLRRWETEADGLLAGLG